MTDCHQFSSCFKYSVVVWSPLFSCRKDEKCCLSCCLDVFYHVFSCEKEQCDMMKVEYALLRRFWNQISLLALLWLVLFTFCFISVPHVIIWFGGFETFFLLKFEWGMDALCAMACFYLFPFFYHLISYLFFN